jgi:hypothetical protein
MAAKANTETPTTTTEPEPDTPDFQPITLTTQAELDEFVGGRVNRARQSEAAKYRDYDKLKTDSAELAALKAASMTQVEKDAARIRELETELANRDEAIHAERAAGLRREIAAAKGVPVDAITGETREALEAAADQLLEWRATAKARGPAAMPAGGSGASTTVGLLKENTAEAQRQKQELAAAMLRQYYGSGGPGRR